MATARNIHSVARALVVSALALWFATPPCHALDGEDDADRGEPLTVTPVLRWDVERVREYLADFELDTSHVEYGVDAYRIEYLTVSATGALTTASSLVAVPRRSRHAFPQAIWLHGTMVYKEDAASVSEDSDDRATALAFASAGYVTTAPDYLGLGLGQGTHPYDDRPTEVSASLDALRATGRFAEWLRIRLDRRVSITGFSQGGASTLALGREIQENPRDGFKVRALAAIGGPFDMSGSLAKAASGEIANATAYLAYLTVAWNRIHYLYAEPSDAFLPPYDQTIESLFDNTHPTEQVLGGLPDTLEELFTPQFLAQLRAPTGALRDALLEADGVCDWKPVVAPVLYTSQGDRDVPIENTRFCEAALEVQGAAVRVVDFVESDHAGTFMRALPQVIDQFDTAQGGAPNT